jgi:hypothetical protein
MCIFPSFLLSLSVPPSKRRPSAGVVPWGRSATPCPELAGLITHPFGLNDRSIILMAFHEEKKVMGNMRRAQEHSIKIAVF